MRSVKRFTLKLTHYPRFALCPHCGFQTRQMLDPVALVWMCQVDPKHRLDLTPRQRAALRG